MHRNVVKKLPKEWRDTDKWPRPPDIVAAPFREAYERRVNAITAYVKGESLRSIAQNEHLSPSLLYSLFDACTRLADDGQICGFRAAVPYAHTKGYQRSKALESVSIERGRGAAGLFTALLTRHAFAAELLVAQAQKYVASEWDKRRIPVGREHRAFLRRLAKVVPVDEYPFIVVNQGREGYRLALVRAIDAARNQLSATIRTSLWREFLPNRPEIFRRVQLDAHRLDKPIPILLVGRKGRGRVKLIRPWLLAAVEVESGACLGWHLCIDAEPSQVDVLACLYSMMNPWTPRERFEISDLDYREGDGMPSGVVTSCRGRFVDAFYLDNALAHHANNLRAVVLTKLHATLHLGSPGEPRTRSEIEQLFNTLTHQNVQHLIGSVRPDMSNRERRRALADAEKYAMTIEWLEEYLEVVICRYNNTERAAHYDSTPLNCLAGEAEDALVRADESDRAAWRSLLTIEMMLTVRASEGHPPHVNYEGAAYSNDLLRVAHEWVGKSIAITVNLMDLRKVEAHLPNGKSLGSLIALREWQHFKHDYRVRKKLNQAIHDGRFRWSPDETPEETVDRFLAGLRRRSTIRRERSASGAPDTRIPVGVSRPRPVADIAESVSFDIETILGDKLEG